MQQGPAALVVLGSGAPSGGVETLLGLDHEFRCGYPRFH